MTVLEKVLSGKWELCVGDGKPFLRTAMFRDPDTKEITGTTAVDRRVTDEDVQAVIANKREHGCIVKYDGTLTHYYTRAFGERKHD